jgi:Kef-type K+ transport system membrane component KefB
MDASIQSFLDTLLEDVWFELTFLLAVSLFAAFLFTRFGQPKVIGYIVIGIIIGPSVLKIIEVKNETFDVVNVGEVLVEDPVMILAQLGALVLLFMIGLECDLKEVYTRKSIMIALGGVIIPWVAGFGTALLFGFSAEAVFIGATLVATSVAVTASVISELGLIGTPVAYAIVGAAVVDDILGMVVLGISKGLSSGQVDAFGIGFLIVGAVLFVTVGAYVGSRFLAKLVFDVQVSGYRRKMPMSGFILVLAIVFLYSFVAELIQISGIVGAFVAGTAFSGSALRDSFRKGTQYLEALFVPLFFVTLGTSVVAGSLSENILFAIILTAVAFASKIAGCAIPAKYAGMSKWDAISVGVGMTPRLEIAFIIAYYGLTSGIIENNVYSVVVFMGIVTALITPPVLKRTLKRGGHSTVSM